MPTTEESIGAWLVDLGITHVYGIAAVPMHDTYRHCAVAGLALVATREQRSAVLMAACHNYLAGKQVACVIVSQGPSATNAVTGSYVTMGNQWPVMILSNSPTQDSLEAGAFQALDIVSLMNPLLKSTELVQQAEYGLQALRSAYDVADTSPRGPVYVGFSTDVLTQQVNSTVNSGTENQPLQRMAEPIGGLAQALSAARRPLLLLGQNIRWDDDYKKIQWLSDNYNIAFATVPMSRGFIPENHPHCVTRCSMQAQSDADLVIVIGGALDWQFRFGVAINPNAAVFQMGKNPLAPDLNRHISLIDTDVSQVQEYLAFSDSKDSHTARDTAWISHMHENHQNALARVLDEHSSLEKAISSYSIAMAAAGVVSDDTLFILDANVTMRASDLCLQPQLPCTHLTAGQTGLMGGGIPYGIAALNENINRAVVVICGDFAFGQCAMELETAARLNLPLVVLLVNNGAASEGIYEFDEYTTSMNKFGKGIRYELIAQAVGGNGRSVAMARELPNAIREALKVAQHTKKPYLIDIKITQHLGMPPRL